MNKIRSLFNRYLLKWDLLLRRGRCLSSPVELQLEATSRCNLACSMCLRVAKKQKALDMGFEDFRRIIDQFPYLNFVTLHGWGEPLLNPDLLKMVDYAKGKGVATAFATNGSLLTSEIRRKLVESNLDRLVFSLDAGEPALFDSIRKNSSLIEIADNIARIVQLKKELKKDTPLLGISATIMKENIRSLDEIIKLAKRLGVPEVSYHVAYYPDKDFYKELGVDKAQLMARLKGLTRLAEPLNIQVRYYTLQFGGRKLCHTAWFLPFVASNGEAFVCCYQQEPMGNVFNRDFRDIWNSRAYREFRGQIKTNPNAICRHCPYLDS